MYDIDPPSPVLHLSAPRKGDGGTVLAQIHAGTSVAARHREALARLAQADPWTTRHSITKATGADVLIFRGCGAVQRLRTLSEDDADISGALDAAL